jgi:hypothetical protein
MVFLILVGMLVLSAAMAAGTLQPVLAALVPVVTLYLIFLTACVLAGYARTRPIVATPQASAPVPQPATTRVIASRVPAR